MDIFDVEFNNLDTEIKLTRSRLDYEIRLKYLDQNVVIYLYTISHKEDFIIDRYLITAPFKLKGSEKRNLIKLAKLELKEHLFKKLDKNLILNF